MITPFQVHVLVGLPGSGKTTVRRELQAKYNIPDEQVVSSDDIIEQFAKDHNCTYGEAFERMCHRAVKEMKLHANKLISRQYSLIWDQTNLSSVKRKAIRQELPPTRLCEIYYHMVDASDADIRSRNLERRRVGRDVPTSILEGMTKSISFDPEELEWVKEFYYYGHPNRFRDMVSNAMRLLGA